MKKSLLSATILSVLTITSFSALADGPNFFGRADLSVSNSDLGYATQNGKAGTVLENNFSLLGVKGTEKITDYLEVIYHMEFGVSNFDNSNKAFTPRNTFLGLKTVAGSVLVGRNDTAFKSSEGNFDVFGNTNADMDRLVSAQTRSADGIFYYSPKIADLITLNATYLVADNHSDEILDPPGNEIKDEYTGAHYAISATLGDKGLKTQNYYVSAGYNQGISDIEAYRAVAQVKLGDIVIGGLYQNSKHVDGDMSHLEGNTYVVNARYNMGKLNLKASYAYDDSGLGSYVKKAIGDIDEGSLAKISDVDLRQITVGADYRISKSTLFFGHYTKYDGDMMSAATKVDLNDDVFTLGMRYDF